MQKHETKADIDNEERIIAEWCARYRKDYEKLYHHGRYKMDYGIFRKHVLCALAEVKKRSAVYDTIILDLSKARDMNNYAVLGVRTLFIVEVPAGIFHYEFNWRSAALFNNVRWHISNVRKTDNGPVIDIPWKHFTQVTDSSQQAREVSA